MSITIIFCPKKKAPWGGKGKRLFWLGIYDKIRQAKMANPISNVVVFVKDVKTEMSRVSWPSKKETIRLTTIVIISSIVMAVLIGALDFIFTKLIELLLK